MLFVITLFTNYLFESFIKFYKCLQVKSFIKTIILYSACKNSTRKKSNFYLSYYLLLVLSLLLLHISILKTPTLLPLLATLCQSTYTSTFLGYVALSPVNRLNAKFTAEFETNTLTAILYGIKTILL